MLATERIDAAHDATRELRQLADAWSAPLHQARADQAEGAVALAAGAVIGARRNLTEVVEWWRKVPAPYEEAMSRALLGMAEEPAARATKPYRTRETRTVARKKLPGEMQVAYLAQEEQLRPNCPL